MNKKQRQDEGWLIVEDGWIPGRFFELDEAEARDRYLEYCRRNYVGSFSYVRANVNGLRSFCRAVGFGKLSFVSG